MKPGRKKGPKPLFSSPVFVNVKFNREQLLAMQSLARKRAAELNKDLFVSDLVRTAVAETYPETVRGKEKEWTNAQVVYLQTNYRPHVKGCKQRIASVLGKTAKAVERKAAKLGLTK